MSDTLFRVYDTPKRWREDFGREELMAFIYFETEMFKAGWQAGRMLLDKEGDENKFWISGYDLAKRKLALDGYATSTRVHLRLV